MSGKVNQKDLEKVQAELDFAKFRYELKLETTKGDIRIEFWPDVAPNHSKNMLGLAKTGFYDGLIFHRIVPGFVIQGGCPRGTGTGGPGFNVNAEFNSRKHEAGVLSMARSQDPNSAGSQFFLCLATVPYLDGQYTAFGKTVDQASLDVVLALGQVKTGSGDRPVEDVAIKKATVSQTPL